MASPKRIILITGDGLEHRYVANRLVAEVELTGIVVDHGKKIGAVNKIRKLFRKYTIGQFASRIFLVIFRKISGDKSARRQSLLSVLRPEDCSEFLRRDLLRHVNGINATEGLRAVTSLEPDVILVFGTGIVGGKVLSLARKIALNMHTGISPYYRGCDCTFWPLHNQELHMLGATVHECTKEVDGGKIFGTIRAQLNRDDGVFSIFARCVMAGANLYVRKVRELIEHDLDGTAQDPSIGTEYKAYMRGLRAEWKVRRNIRAGLIDRFIETRQAAKLSYESTVDPNRI